MNILKYIPLAFLVIGLYSSCDEVENEQDRFISLGEVDVKRNVLLEDYTGQFCTNCPEAHEIADALKTQYGDALVVVSIHATSAFGISESNGGLMTDDGNVYLSQWDDVNNVSLPMGVINRTSGLCKASDWAANVRTALEQETQVELTLSVDTTVTGDSIRTTVNIDHSLTADVKLQLWVIEDSIIARQSTTTGTNRQYVHNRVYRGAINGVGGEVMSLQENILSESIVRTTPIKETWTAENLSVVGFIYTDNDGVLQVVQSKINQ